MNIFNYGLCPCCVRLSLAYYLRRVCEEGLELLQHPCMDELCDVMACLSQAISIIVHKDVMLPFASKAFSKGRSRVQAHGCVRSKRNKCTK